jgi:hypothetical protein
MAAAGFMAGLDGLTGQRWKNAKLQEAVDYAGQGEGNPRIGEQRQGEQIIKSEAAVGIN